MRKDLLIRDAVRGDMPTLLPLLEALGYPADEASAISRFDLFTTRGNGHVLVGEIGTEIVTFAATEMKYPLHTAGPTLLVTAFAVSPKHQRGHIGRTMIGFIEDWAREQGCTRISVTSAEHRDGAHAFYPAVGWAYTGRRYGKKLRKP